MSTEVGSISGKIALDESPADMSLQRFNRSVKTMKEGFGRNLDGMEDKFKGLLKGLKGDFGKGSALGQGLKLAAGGGAIAGLSLD